MGISNKHHAGAGSDNVELAIFNVSDLTCALKSIEVQEIIRVQEITDVHHAPDFVSGVINLRGQIVTIIDMRKKFSCPPGQNLENMRIVIMKMGEESVGLLVDGVRDILLAPSDEIEPPPSNIRGLNGDFFVGIYKKNDALVAILNINEILKVE
jgi:purine-binding chemotaxis protein CheW